MLILGLWLIIKFAQPFQVFFSFLSAPFGQQLRSPKSFAVIESETWQNRVYVGDDELGLQTITQLTERSTTDMAVVLLWFVRWLLMCYSTIRSYFLFLSLVLAEDSCRVLWPHGQLSLAIGGSFNELLFSATTIFHSGCFFWCDVFSFYTEWWKVVNQGKSSCLFEMMGDGMVLNC